MGHNTLGYTEGAGKSVAVDEVGAAAFQRVKLTLGVEGVDGGDVSSSNALPVSEADGANAALGAKADAPAAADNSTASLIALLKRQLGHLTTLNAAVATAPKQDIGNASLASIDTKLSSPLNVSAATVDVSGSTVIAVTGGLTDAQLRAAPVPVSGTVSTGLVQSVTDAQLRATPVPVSGTVTANLGTTAGLALDATLTGGTQKAIARSGVKGTSAAADITSTASGANHQAADVILYDAAGNAIDPRLIRAIASGTDSITVVQGAPGATPWKVDGSGVTQPVSGTVTANLAAGTNNIGDVDVLSLPAIPAGTNNIGDVDVLTMPAIVGGRTNNNAVPGATNIGALIALVSEALQAYTEGNLALPAIDLRGAFRVIDVPMANLGVYEVMFKTGTYGGLAANTPLFSMRWGDATRFGVLLRFRSMVITSAAATAAGITERQLILARAFTVSDSGGTSFLPAGNSAKRRTSMGTTLLTDMRAGPPITAGTRTLDANPIAAAAGWSGLLSTGIVIGASGGSAVGAARSTEGGTGMIDLYNALNGQDYPVTFAQNEGAVLRIGAAQPTGSTQETWGSVLWLEANKVF